jgi:type IX secretion system substrate protein
VHNILTLALAICIIPAGVLQSQTTGILHRSADYLDINNINYWVCTFGCSGRNMVTGGSGGEYPRGSGKNFMLIDGFLIGGYLGENLHVGGATYRYGFQNGPILPDGTANRPGPHNRIQNIKRQSAASYFALPVNVQSMYYDDFHKWPVEDGAPWLDRNANGIYEPDFYAWLADSTSSDCPLFQGDQVLWYVSNDLDALKTQRHLGVDPIGLELRTMMWAYDKPGTLGNTIFTRYTLINRNSDTLKSAYIGRWGDPDLGYPFDDYLGIDTIRDMGFAYNAHEYDSIYGSAPPAMGFVLLQGPAVPHQGSKAYYRGRQRLDYVNLGVTSFMYVPAGGTNGAYPPLTLGSSRGATMAYNYFQGRSGSGRPYIDPTTGLEVSIPFAGDPLLGTGWTDGILWGPAEIVLMVGTGPFDLAPEDTLEVVWALVIAKGTDRLNSVVELRKSVEELHDHWRQLHTTEVESGEEYLQEFALESPYPNPVLSGNATSISFTLPKHEYVSLAVYNILGEKVETVYEGITEQGRQFHTLSTTDLKPGVYCYILRSSLGTQSKRFVVQ